MQGNYYFLDLQPGKNMVRNNWTALPMPAEGLTTINQYAKNIRAYYSQTS